LAFNLKFEEHSEKFEGEQLQKIREKLFLIHKEKAELLCKSIKFSTKIMSRILSSVENHQTLKLSDTELLIKIKLFLKITRMVVENSKDALDECKSEKEKDFFTM